MRFQNKYQEDTYVSEKRTKELQTINEEKELTYKLANMEKGKFIPSSQLNFSIVTLQNKAQSLETHVQELITKTTDLEQQLKSTKSKYSLIIFNLSMCGIGKLTELTTEKTLLSGKLSTAETELEVQKSETAKLRHKVSELQNFKNNTEKENFSEKFYLSDKENKKLKEANYKVTTQVTRDYEEIQSLKDENFELKSEAKEQAQTIAQLNKFLKETKDELDDKNMLVFEMKKEISAFRIEFKKLENFSKGKKSKNVVKICQFTYQLMYRCTEGQRQTC